MTATLQGLDPQLELLDISVQDIIKTFTEESSKYIQSQILQQASATLLATANQSPSIALNLL